MFTLTKDQRLIAFALPLGRQRNDYAARCGAEWKEANPGVPDADVYGRD